MMFETAQTDLSVALVSERSQFFKLGSTAIGDFKIHVGDSISLDMNKAVSISST